MVLAGLVGLALMLPSLVSGPFLDDYAQIALIEQWDHLPNTGGSVSSLDPYNLYSFLGDYPLDPWWEHPDFKVRMWRPLSSVLLWLDNQLFGHQMIAYHAHSLLWFAGLLGACGLLYRRILPPVVSVLALAVFSLDECHILTAGWIANRHAMVSMVPALLGLLAHLRWREDNWRPGILLSVVGCAVGLLGGETALAIMAYIGAYELFRLFQTLSTRSSDGCGETAISIVRSMIGLVPVVLVGLCYTFWYKIGSYGALSSGFYLDPAGEPAQFVKSLAGHLPALLAGGLIGLPADLWFFEVELRPLLIVTGVVGFVAYACLVVVSWQYLTERERHALGWLLPGSALALLPAAASQPFDRSLTAGMFGGAAFLAILMHSFWQRSGITLHRRTGKGTAGGGSKTRLLIAIPAVLLAAVHLGLPSIARISMQRYMMGLNKGLAEIVNSVPPEAANKHVILAVAPDIVIGGFIPLAQGFQQGTHASYPVRSWDILSMAPYAHCLSHAAPRKLVLRPLLGPEAKCDSRDRSGPGWPCLSSDKTLDAPALIDSPPERFHRPKSSPLLTTADLRPEVSPGNSETGSAGARFPFRVEILDHAAGRGPTCVAFEFSSDLESGDLIFLQWDGHRLVKLGLPNLNESIVLGQHFGPGRAMLEELLSRTKAR